MRLTTGDDRLAIPVQLTSAVAAMVVSGALLLIFARDRATGSAPVQHLYYLPIMLAGLHPLPSPSVAVRAAMNTISPRRERWLSASCLG